MPLRLPTPPRPTSGRPAVAVGLVAALVAGLVAVLVVLLVVGGVALRPAPSPERPAAPAPVPVSAAQLLQPTDVHSLAPRQGWTVVDTNDNTEGDGLNTVCQRARYADPAGEGALVRTLTSDGAGGNPRKLVRQTVEVSATTQAATDSYRAALGWFAGCGEARLVSAWRVAGLGARAEVLQLQATLGGEPRSHVVGLVRSDRVLVWLAAETVGGPAVTAETMAGLMRQATVGLCVADPAGSCPGEEPPAVTSVSAPPSGEAPGTLAGADLPVLASVEQAWVGTSTTPAQPNPAATACDGADFVGGGAPGATSRSYLVPDADLPPRFGLTQTVGSFPGPPRAAALVDGIAAAVARCAEEDLATTVTVSRAGGEGRRTVAMWRLEQEVSEDRVVAYWMGTARVGRHVTQVLFTPAGGIDVDEATFAELMERAADRLTELTAGRGR